MPDDLPIAPSAEESAGSARPDKARIRGVHRQGPESEVRGGAERPDDPPLEQQRRAERHGDGGPEGSG